MTTIKSTSRPTKIISAENRFHAYSNHSGVASTNFDLKLLFGEIQSGTESELTVIEHGDVTMSPQHAKAFLNNLAQAIDKYESMFGEIKVPSIVLPK